MKHQITIFLSLIIIACLLTSCGTDKQSSKESISETLKTYQIEEMTVKIPKTWEYSPKNGNHCFYIGQDGYVFDILSEKMDEGTFSDESFGEFVEGIKDNCKDKFFLEKSKDSKFINEKSYYVYEYITDINDSRTHCKTYLTYFNYHLYSLTFSSKGNVMLTTFQTYENTILESISFDTVATLPVSKTTGAPSDQSSTTEEPTTEATTTQKPTEPPTEAPKIINNTSANGFWAEGSGDYVAEGLQVTEYAVLHVEYTGTRHFSVKSYIGESYEDLLVSTTGSYSGDVLIDKTGNYDLVISASGDWKITSSGLSVDDTTSFSGYGDSVTGITTSSGGTWHITNDDNHHFHVKEYDLSRGYIELLVNQSGSIYDGVVKVKTGDCIFFVVGSKGNWTITKQ